MRGTYHHFEANNLNLDLMCVYTPMFARMSSWASHTYVCAHKSQKRTIGSCPKHEVSHCMEDQSIFGMIQDKNIKLNLWPHAFIVVHVSADLYR